MPSPFPGMDPYLEPPGLWPNVHTSLMIALRDELAPQLRPRYYVAVEERTVQLSSDDLLFATRPDLTVVAAPTAAEPPLHAPSIPATEEVTVEVPLPDVIREVYLEIRAVDTDQVITVIELRSPTNKLVGEGRRQYERKRLELLCTLTHLVEVDLLRAGQPMPFRGAPQGAAYRILISRAPQRPSAQVFLCGIRQPIPSFQLPLQPGDAEPVVALNQLLHSLYDRAGYDLRIDYTPPPPPPDLAPDEHAWLDARLREVELR
ncbi:MAG: DUF4058 family protein [Chloroflexaceae bacterium]